MHCNLYLKTKFILHDLVTQLSQDYQPKEADATFILTVRLLDNSEILSAVILSNLFNFVISMISEVWAE